MVPTFANVFIDGSMAAPRIGSVTFTAFLKKSRLEISSFFMFYLFIFHTWEISVIKIYCKANILKPNVVGHIWRESIFEYSDSETAIILQI